MAKKVVAALKTGAGKVFTKCIKMTKSDKTGAYQFKEEIVHNDHVKDFFGKSNIDHSKKIFRAFFNAEGSFFYIYLINNNHINGITWIFCQREQGEPQQGT